jgi:sugar phosphate isomerase/epimerase
MRLAISNIAWPLSEEDHVAELLQRAGVAGIEIAPTKIWPAPLEASELELEAYRAFWQARGVSIVAAQSLLFGKPELTIFEDAETRSRTLAYLQGMTRVCARLGCQALVFGSPKNRRIGGLPIVQARAIAQEFFGHLAESAEREGTAVVLEANPPAYGADFITRAADAIDLVKRVNHPGLRLHLDTACMTLAGDPIAETIAAGRDYLWHLHISQPFLAPVAADGIDHRAFAQALREQGYARWVSIEMREPEPFTADTIGATLRFAGDVYGK